jgi:hypothetical protein
MIAFRVSGPDPDPNGQTQFTFSGRGMGVCFEVASVHTQGLGLEPQFTFTPSLPPRGIYFYRSVVALQSVAERTQFGPWSLSF